MAQEETSAVDPLIGHAVGSLEIVAKIREESLGDVYKIVHINTGKRLAIKVFRTEGAHQSEIAERCRFEALAVNQIGHPNIIDVIDFSVLPDGRPYLVMEFLEGQSLASYLRQRGPLPPSEVGELLLPICSALAAAHEHHIVHRNLKPANIQLVPQQANPRYVKVLDFGIAELAHTISRSRPRTGTGVIMGTPAYMSPEQAMSRDREVDHRTDIYALGVLTYQLLTGVLPFEGDNFGDLMIAHLQAIPRPVFELRADIPPVWNDIVQTALAKDPAHRFQSMAAVADAVRAATTTTCAPTRASGT